MSPTKKYGHISRGRKDSQAWRWAIVGLVCLWGLGVCLWNTSRVAALFDYHSGLGKPAFVISGRSCYWPWALPQWAARFQQYEEVTRIVDQTYLLGAGVPLILFLLYLASQQGLKGRDDLHGSARWAEYQDIDKMGYLKSEGVYVGGWWEPKKKIHCYLRHNGPEHVLCFAPTRSGKGVGLILPTLLAWGVRLGAVCFHQIFDCPILRQSPIIIDNYPVGKHFYLNRDTRVVIPVDDSVRYGFTKRRMWHRIRFHALYAFVG